MLDDLLFEVLARVERAGVGLSIVAWLAVAAGVMLMARAIRNAGGPALRAGVAAGLVALAANLLDYAVTLSASPDLALEANPLWRNVLDRFGLGVARAYGLSGKILVSILAGQLFAFYVANVERLFPDRAAFESASAAGPGPGPGFGFGRIWRFTCGLGGRSTNLRERLLALFTLGAFLFAGIQLLYFYVAFLNSMAVDHPALLESMPSLSSAIAILMLLLGVTFVVVTWRAFVRAGGPASDGPAFGGSAPDDPAFDGSAVDVDLLHASCGRTALGRLPNALEPWAERLHRTGTFRSEALGIELGLEQGRLDSICIDVTRFRGRLRIGGEPAAVGPATTEAELRELLGEPWWRDEDADEVLLFYEDGRVERQFEFSGQDRRLTAFTLLLSPLMADPEQRRAYGVTRPWPPSGAGAGRK